MSQLHFLVVVLTLLASPPSWAFESLLHPEPIPAPNLNNCTEANLVWGVKKGGMALQSLPAECTTLDLSNTRIGDGKAEALAAALKLPGAPTLEVLKLQRNSIGSSPNQNKTGVHSRSCLSHCTVNEEFVPAYISNFTPSLPLLKILNTLSS